MRGELRDDQSDGDESGVFRASVGEIHRLAQRQHALVTRPQLLALGLDRRLIDRRLRARRLFPVRRGVYRIGPIAQPLEDEMAACLSVGPRAVLSHQSAALLHQLLPHPAKPDFVHLSVTGSDPGPKPGIRIRRTRHLPADETTRRQRIPITTPTRTILDIAPDLTHPVLEQVLAQAHRRSPATTTNLHSLIARYPGRPGVPALAALLRGKPKLSRSRPERRLLEAFRLARLPEPEVTSPARPGNPGPATPASR
jgi:hypothetical protein